MLFGRDGLAGERSWFTQLTGNHNPLNAPYFLPKAVNIVERHSTRVLAAILDLPPTLRDRIGDLVRLAVTPILRTRQKYIFQYVFRLERLVDAAVGAKAQVEAALELEEGSQVMDMFMGRKPFAKEIRCNVYSSSICME